MREPQLNTIDVVVDKDSEATVRVRFIEGTPDTFDEPGTPSEIEVVDAWFATDGRDAKAALDAFGVDIYSMYESIISAAVEAEHDQHAEALAQIVRDDPYVF